MRFMMMLVCVLLLVGVDSSQASASENSFLRKKAELMRAIQAARDPGGLGEVVRKHSSCSIPDCVCEIPEEHGSYTEDQGFYAGEPTTEDCIISVVGGEPACTGECTFTFTFYGNQQPPTVEDTVGCEFDSESPFAPGGSCSK